MSKYRGILIGGGILALVLFSAIFFFGVRRTDQRFSGVIMLWSFEDEDIWKDLIRTFKAEYPNLKVRYEQKNVRTYENELLNALAASRGPDLFVAHHTWLTKHNDKMTSAPKELLTFQEFRQAYVDVAVDELTRFEEFVAGVPLYIDTLALYYNTDIFDVSGITRPPKTWSDFNEAVKRTTIRNDEGVILQAGAALGTQNNVLYADDILETLMLQNGAQMSDIIRSKALFAASQGSRDGKSFNPGENALLYYTNFADPARDVYTWSRRQDDALSTFLAGNSAMYLGYAQDINKVRASGVAFDIAPIPQVADRQVDPSYIDTVLARYWTGVVSASSPKKEAAWAFWTLAGSRNAQFNWLTKTNLPTSRRDLVDVQSQHDAQLGVFARQSLIAESWRQPDYLQVAAIFKNMIEEVVLGRSSPEEAVRNGEDQVTALFKGVK